VDATTPAQPSAIRRLLCGTIHRLSYHFTYERRRTRVTRVAGLHLIVPPTVFHPRWFLTSEFFAAFIAQLDLRGKRVADVGTGSGILRLQPPRPGPQALSQLTSTRTRHERRPRTHGSTALRIV